MINDDKEKTSNKSEDTESRELEEEEVVSDGPTGIEKKETTDKKENNKNKDNEQPQKEEDNNNSGSNKDNEENKENQKEEKDNHNSSIIKNENQKENEIENNEEEGPVIEDIKNEKSIKTEKKQLMIENIIKEEKPKMPNLQEKIEFRPVSKEEKERKIGEEIHSLLTQLVQKKAKGNELYGKSMFNEAITAYTEGITLVQTFNSNYSEINPNESILTLLNEVNKYLVQIYGNISVCLKKQGKIEEAINYSLMGHQCDPTNIKVYVRLISWYIELNQIEKANEFAKLVKQIPNYEQSKELMSTLIFLDSKNKEIEEKNKSLVKNKKEKSNSWWYPLSLGTAALVSGGLLFTLFYKHGSKFIKI